jgi:hypothetical protein
MAGCMKPSGSELKSSKLKAHFNAVPSGGSVTCVAWISEADDSTSTPIQLEANTVATCDNSGGSSVMSWMINDYQTVMTYVPGTYYMISVFRPVDGSTFTQSIRVP